ncbi:MAG TPA: CsgG/HfaB family protein [Rhodocyclaceae bacterium]|nr:CsgG/HfaB family protein [Rhodocyclaceae bacterium]
MNVFRKSIAALVAASSLAISSGALAFDTGYQQGSADASGQVTGAAGVNGGQNAAPTLEHCDRPFGKIAVYEPQDAIQRALMSYRLPSPTGLLRLMIQQSNCFVVVERGVAMKNIMQERHLAEGGLARAGSNMGGGQMASADFVLTPEVVFSDNNAGGVGGGVTSAIGGLFGPLGRVAGAIAGGVRFKQAQTTLILADTRSGVQVAAAQGSSEKTDWALGGILGGAGGAIGLGAYESTAEGKVVASAFLNAYNNVVAATRGSPELNRDTTSLKQEAGTVTRAGASFEEGDVVQPKIARIRVYTSPTASAKPAAQFFQRGGEAVVEGKEKDGFIFIRGDGFEGWVEKHLIRKIQS